MSVAQILIALALVACLVTSGDHIHAEWAGKLSARLADLYHSRELPPSFYGVAAAVPTVGLAALGVFLPAWRPLLWAAAAGGYTSDRFVVHGIIERKALAVGEPSMPGSGRRGALLVCAALLAVAVFVLRGPLLPCLAAYAAGWLPFLALLPLQAALRVRR